MFVHRAALRKVTGDGLTILVGQAEITIQSTRSEFMLMVDAPSEYDIATQAEEITRAGVALFRAQPAQMLRDGLRLRVGEAVVTFQVNPVVSRIMVLVDAPTRYEIEADPLPLPDDTGPRSGGNNRKDVASDLNDVVTLRY